RSLLAASFVAALFSVAAAAQGGAQTRPSGPAADYIVGAQDVLTITCYDQADLSGKFTVETDGTFSYPLIGRVKVGGLTLRQVESEVKTRLVGDGYFRNPQITVSVDTYKSQKVFVVGEVRTPGTYALSGDMNLVEALARAGSTLPTASGEAIVVHPEAGQTPSGPTLPTAVINDGGDNVVRIDLRDLQNGSFSQNALLRDGDTIFVPRAESVSVFGHVKNPGRIEIASGFDGIDAGAAPPISAAGPNGRGPTYGYGSNVIGDGEVHLLDYVKVLYKRRWTAITAFLVVFLSVTIYTFTATPIYEAKVQILIEKENTNVVTFKEAFEQNQIADDYYQTQYKILQS